LSRYGGFHCQIHAGRHFAIADLDKTKQQAQLIRGDLCGAVEPDSKETNEIENMGDLLLISSAATPFETCDLTSTVSIPRLRGGATGKATRTGRFGFRVPLLAPSDHDWAAVDHVVVIRSLLHIGSPRISMLISGPPASQSSWGTKGWSW
jgi:hypothetical protein